MIFADRLQAGTVLAELLLPYSGQRTVIYGVLKGGLEVAWAVAQRLTLPLYPAPVRKIRSPDNPEYALGALTPTGTTGTEKEDSPAYQTARDKLSDLVAILPDRYLVRPAVAETAILIDDGVATGNSLMAAAGWLLSLGYKKCILGTPVASKPAYKVLSRMYPVVASVVAPDFRAVGAYYHRFDEVTMERVLELLENGKGGISSLKPEEYP